MVETRVTSADVLLQETEYTEKTTYVRRWTLSREDVVLFLGFLGLYVGVACYLILKLRIHHNDAIARTALGYFVIYSRDPHLAAIGFVWPPLVSLLQIPLFPLLRWMGQPVLAGPLLSAIFGAATLPILNLTGRHLGVHRGVRLPIVLLYGLHPTILLYAATGMSEIVFFFFMVMAIHYLFRWVSRQSRHTSLTLVGTLVAFAFWTRYEAIPLLMGICVVVFAVLLTWTSNDPPLFQGSLEALWITVLVPGMYSVFLWMFFNWNVMGAPLFFLRSSYSNLAYTEQFRSPVNPLFHNLAASLVYGLERVEFQFPIFPLFAIFAIGLSLWQRSVMPVLPLFILGPLLLFHIYLNYTGGSYGWYRFYTYVLPIAVSGFFWLLTCLRKRKSKQGVAITMLIGLVASMITTIVGMTNPAIGKEEASFMQAILTGGSASQDEYRSYATAREVAAYIDRNSLDGLILLDSYLGFPIVLFAKHPEQFVITQDREFQEALHDPPGYGIRWVLVPLTDEFLRRNEWILKTYPDIWDVGVPWATLAKDFGRWRLFRVISNVHDTD